LADSVTKQLIETVKNVVPLTGGLAVRSMPVQGTLSDMQNFKIEDGVLKLRDGSKKIASLENKRFHFLKSFEFCGSEVLLGLDMQRRLYAWFENYEGYTFTVRDSSPFHKARMSLSDWQDGVLFQSGSKFWAYDNQKYIMFFNDIGEIRLIVKDGGFHIDKAEQWITVDIKDATNRVFDIPPSWKTDNRGIAPRITGELRFARVNEMGVVSELSDPQYLQEYNSIFAARIPVQTFSGLPLEKIEESEAQSNYKYIAADSGGIHVAEDSWVKPGVPSNYSSAEVPAMVLVVCEDTELRTVENIIFQDNSESTGYQECFLPDVGGVGVTTIRKGIYLVLMDGTTFSADLVPISTRNYWHPGAYYFFDAELKAVKYPQYNVHSMCETNTRTWTLRRDATAEPITVDFPQYNPYYGDKKPLSDVLFNNVCGEIFFRDKKDINGTYYLGTGLPRKSSIDSSYVFNISRDKMREIFMLGKAQLFRLDDNDELFREAGQEHFTISCARKRASHNNFAMLFSGRGKLYAIDKFKIFSRRNNLERSIAPADAVAYRYKSTTGGYDSVYIMSDMDTLEYKGEFKSTVSIGEDFYFDASTGRLVSANSKADFIAQKADVANLTDRFAIWNNNKILAISQRLFAEKSTPHIPVYGKEHYFHDPLTTLYSPVISLEYMNQRAFRYDLPVICRAMRKPDLLCVSNNTVYSFEENRLWYGDAYDFMLRGYASLDGTLLIVIPYNEGVLACTSTGLYYVRREDVQPVVNGRNVVADYAGQSQVGGIIMSQNKIFIVRTEITDSGARIETAHLISPAIEDIVFEGRIKIACNRRQIYLADDYNVYGYDTEAGIWNLRFNYHGKRISEIFILDGRLGVLFDNQVDESEVYYIKPVGVDI